MTVTMMKHTPQEEAGPCYQSQVFHTSEEVKMFWG
jgi:hypothetical protein